VWIWVAIGVVATVAVALPVVLVARDKHRRAAAEH
jgi:hypothetical protein